MSLATQPPESDLIIPLPGEGETWDPHTIHTHYFGFSIPDAEIGGFLYLRYMPAFPLCQGGAVVFRGMDNVRALDVEFSDYEVTMPWPDVQGNTISTRNGLTIDFTEPGSVARVTFASEDGACMIDTTHTAVTPLLARGHIMPGEELHVGNEPGGSEQFMHCTGTLTLNGEQYAIDCHTPRDRSWRQVRTERRGAVETPPVCWTPMYFGPDKIFNQISIEAPDTDPAWKGIHEWPEGQRTHHYAWLVEDDEALDIVRVRRNVTKRHPDLFVAIEQEVEAEDERGRVHRFQGRSIATSAMIAWPNVSFADSVFRWEDEQGRVAHATCQEIYFDKYHRAMLARARSA
jgi:hypothetical protein